MDHRRAGLSDREVAVLDYALAVAVGGERPELVARLREVGLDDAAILEVAFTAGFRLLGSRLYDALGVETDPFFLEQEDLVGALPPRHKETPCQ
jgi:alkylhydroperoxidase family enzyme